MTSTEILQRQRSLIEDLQEMNAQSTPNPRRDQIAADLMETNEQLSAIVNPEKVTTTTLKATKSTTQPAKEEASA